MKAATRCGGVIARCMLLVRVETHISSRRVVHSFPHTDVEAVSNAETRLQKSVASLRSRNNQFVWCTAPISQREGSSCFAASLLLSGNSKTSQPRLHNNRCSSEELRIRQCNSNCCSEDRSLAVLCTHVKKPIDLTMKTPGGVRYVGDGWNRGTTPSTAAKSCFLFNRRHVLREQKNKLHVSRNVSIRSRRAGHRPCHC